MAKSRNAAATPGDSAADDPKAAFSEAIRLEIARAADHCRARRGTLTDLRQLVLGLMYQHDGPIGAYDLIQQLGGLTGRNIGPPTVYRALEFLLEMGLIARVVSRNAFVACDHPEEIHQCMFFICRNCGNAIELVDSKLDKILSQDARAIGFTPDHRVVEVEGTCNGCVGG